jgi:hypothetical protein
MCRVGSKLPHQAPNQLCSCDDGGGLASAVVRETLSGYTRIVIVTLAGGDVRRGDGVVERRRSSLVSMLCLRSAVARVGQWTGDQQPLQFALT